MVTVRNKVWFYDHSISSNEETTTIQTKGDTYINSGAVNDSYGWATQLLVGQTAGDKRRILFSIKFPDAPKDAGRITNASLYLYQESSNYVVTSLTMTMIDIKPKYISGLTSSTLDWGATWNKYDGFIDWEDDDRNGEGIRAFDTTTVVNDSSYIEFNIKELMIEENLTWGSVYDVMILVVDEANGDNVTFTSMEGTNAQRPKLVLDYELEQQEIPDTKDEVLDIEPNPANPTQPLLKWKTPNNTSLRIDSSGGFCLVKSETIIDAITDGTLIARINQGEEYVDNGGILATTENNLYYYKLYFCDELNYISGSGTGLMSGLTIYGDPTPSNQVWMIRPDVASFIFTADYIPDVKEQRTATITATVAGDFALTPTPVQHSKYQFDWKGDSTEVGWVELETPANLYAKTHYYLAYQGATSAKARIENSLGFWSDATNSDDTVTVTSITPIPLINVSPKAMLHDTQETGTATGTQSASTLQDTSQSWTINEFAGKTITIHLDGAWLYEQRVISSNTADTITIAPNWSNNPTTATTLYEIVTVFDGVLRVLGDQSYARSSNETITKYEFSVQRTSDSAYYSAAGGPPPPFWVAGATWNDLLTVPYMDITANNMGAEDTYTCLVRVTSSDFGLSSTSATTTMTVTTTVTIDMKTTLTSSNFAVQNMGRNRTKQKHGVIEGTSDTIIDSGIQSPSFRVSGNCYGENFQTDYDQLNTWENDDTLLKIYTDPQAPTSSKFIEGWIEGLSITKRLKQNISWECNFVVKNATL